MSFPPGTTKKKDPSAVKPYEAHYTQYLNGAIITASEWVIQHVPDEGETEEDPPTLTVDSDEILSGSRSTRVVLSGGTLGLKYRVTNRITTDTIQARPDDRSFFIEIVET
jgi:hypothetical protein